MERSQGALVGPQEPQEELPPVEQPVVELDVVKGEIHEMSAQAGEIKDLGILAGDSDPKLWTGSISYDKRVGEGKELSVATVEAQLTRLNEFFVRVTKGAPKRCVDGRTIDGYDDNDPEKYGRALGPQVQGGTVDEAVAYRALTGYEPGATIVNDVEAYAEGHESDFLPGDHDSDPGHVKPGGTGCGAVDGQPQKSDDYANPEKAALIGGTTETLLSLDEKKAPQGTLAKLQQGMASLSANKETYFANLPKALDVLKKYGSHTIERLPATHGELSATINFVRGTTFHRDHYNAETGGAIQNFNLDVWNIIDEHPIEEAYAIIADAVETLMGLTDGTLRLFARLPKEADQ